MIKNHRGLASYFSALSLPKEVVNEYSLLISAWEANSGIDWTITRQKTIYTDLIHFLAKEPLVGKWYKKNREGLPRGILSRLFKMASNKKFTFSVMTLLRSYTMHVSSSVTETQKSKFLDGVNASITDIPNSLTDSVIDVGVSCVGITRCVVKQPSYLSYTPSTGKRVPTYWGTTLPELENWSTQWETIEETTTGRYLRSKYNNIFKDVFAGFTPMRIGVKSFGPTGIDSVGKIGLIQEPGHKLRAVANPNRIYQIALKPLGDVIYDTIKRLPWDCTFDQTKALPFLTEHLRLQRTAYCVDLTGATDYFPLDLQLSLLSKLFPDHSDYISLFKDLSRSPWFFQDTTISWQRGQPLGLYPSFGSFALTHGFLLLSLCSNGYENNFFVLGDDVVILDDGLYQRYRDTLKVLQCPISESKSIISQDIIEFGGKIISKDNIFPQLKWKLMSDDNFVDIIRLLGIKALRLLRPRQRKVVKAIMDIPDFVGGLGFNPGGLPLSDRYEKYLSLFGEDSGTFLMSLDRKHNLFFFEENTSPNSSRSLHLWNNQELPDLDQRSAALCLKYLPHLSKMYNVLGTNLYSVVLNKDMLPIDGFAGKRKTLLSLLEKKLM